MKLKEFCNNTQSEEVFNVYDMYNTCMAQGTLNNLYLTLGTFILEREVVKIDMNFNEIIIDIKLC